MLVPRTEVDGVPTLELLSSLPKFYELCNPSKDAPWYSVLLVSKGVLVGGVGGTVDPARIVAMRRVIHIRVVVQYAHFIPKICKGNAARRHGNAVS